MRLWPYRIEEAALRNLPELGLFSSEDQRRDALQRLQRLDIPHRSVRSIIVPLIPGTVSYLAGLLVIFGPLRTLPLALRIPLGLVIIWGGTDLLHFVIAYLSRREAERFLRIRLLELGVPVCLVCGYCVRGVASDRCPECGVELSPRVREVMAYPARDGSMRGAAS